VAGVVIRAIYGPRLRAMRRGGGPMSSYPACQSEHPQLQGGAQSHTWSAQMQLSVAGFSCVDTFPSWIVV